MAEHVRVSGVLVFPNKSDRRAFDLRALLAVVRLVSPTEYCVAFDHCSRPTMRGLSGNTCRRLRGECETVAGAGRLWAC